MKRVRGFTDLIFDVVDETTNLIELTHNEVVALTGSVAERTGIHGG